jgi:hypothetical protein
LKPVTMPRLWHLSVTESSVALPPQKFEVSMDRYIHDQNLAHYRKALSETTDPTKRQTLLRLLADEQANVRQQTETKGSP